MEHLKTPTPAPVIEGVDPKIVEEARNLSIMGLINYVAELINSKERAEEGMKLKSYLDAHGWHLN